MSDEPTPPHPLEAALRAQAERRRADLDAGRPPQLPGPVRSALLRELERGAVPTREERVQHSTPWWWRWQTLLVTTACVMLAVGIFRRETNSPPTTAEKVSRPSAAAPPPVAARQESASPAEERRTQEVVPTLEQAAPRDVDRAAAAPAPAPVVPPAGASGRAYAERPVPPADERPVPQPPPAAPIIRLDPSSPPGGPIASAPAASTDAVLGGAAKPPATALATASQRFLQTPLQQTMRAAKSVGSSPVLTDFTLRREGDTLVIRERDGSEYRAPIAADKREASGTDAFKKDASRRSIAANEAPAASSESVPFRATGLNNTLKQTVVIEGVLRPAAAEESRAPAAPFARSRAAAAPAPAKPREPAAVRAASPSRASIQGRAIISGKEYAVEAEEAGPPASR